MLSINPVSMGYLRPADLASAEGLKEKQAFEQMEQIYLHTLLKEMRKSVPDGGLFKKSNSMKIFEDMLDEVMSLKMAESGQLGIAAAIEAQYRARETALEAARDPSNQPHFQGLK